MLCKYTTLKNLHKLNDNYKHTLLNAAKLCHIGEYLNFYFANEHSAHFVLGGLNYGFSHKEKALIASIIKLNGKKLILIILNPINNFYPIFIPFHGLILFCA